MNNEKYGIMAIIFLGLAVIISSYFVSSSIKEISSKMHMDTRDIESAVNRITTELHEFRQDNNGEKERKNYMYMTEAAEYLGLSRKELTYLIEEEKVNIPYIKIGRKYVFYKNSLDDWLKNLGQQEYNSP